ncbi:MAG: hypothetical protein JWP10_2011 [Nocardioidaceae bacterium]|nr:hypothetical protein [Nocardioidaceae bacterium]
MYVARLTRVVPSTAVLVCALLIAGAFTLPRASADEVVVTPPKVDVSTIAVPTAEATTPEEELDATPAPDEPPAPVATVTPPPEAKPAVDTDDSEIVAELPATKTDGFGMVGVTWSAASTHVGVSVEVRTRTAGVWSAWQELEVDSESTEGGRNGTEPLWVGSANGVAARVYTESGIKPADIKISTIDPGVTPTNHQATQASFTTQTAPSTPEVGNPVTPIADGSPAFTGKPTIITRAQWGASAGNTCDTPLTGKTAKGIILHHTAGSNTYTKAQSAAIVRATQSYHVKSRKWCDIGYNVLVDRFGQIFEGRKGGIDKPVRGAHAGNLDVNTYAWGVSMMGNFDTAPLTPALEASVVKVIGWRLGTTYTPAKGTYAIAGKRLNIISGHRDVSLSGIRPATATACPGKYGYAWLNESGGLRDRVAAYIAGYKTAIKTYAQKLGTSATGLVYVGEYVTGGGSKTRFSKADFYSKAGAGTHYLNGTMRSEFNRVGSQTGVLGFPTTNPLPAATKGVVYARFQGGSMYRVLQPNNTNKAFAFYGPIDTKYRALKGNAGKLGKPTTAVYRYSKNPNVLKARFQGGYIKYDTINKSFKVAYK